MSHQSWDDGSRGRRFGGFTISMVAVGVTALLALSCGDGAVEPPAPPPAPVATTVTVNPGSAALSALGETARLAAEVRDQNGQVMAGAAVAWASSDASVASVDASGLVTAAANGNATITATAGSVSGTAAVTVAQVVSAVAVTPAADTLVAFGDTVRLVAEATDANGHGVASVTTFAWASSDTLVAAVDSAGLVTAAGGGTTSVTATAGDVSGSVVVTVMQSAGSVVVSPSEASIAAGDTLRLEAEAFDENGHAVDGAEFVWSSSDAAVATVDDSGLVTGVAEGTARITARSGAALGLSEVTVENPDRAALVALYQATDGPNWLDNTNWLSEAPLGEWYGVETDASGRVVALNLRGSRENRHGLAGTIPPEVGNLANLRTLDLAYNILGGAIPPELGNLANLSTLILSTNFLTEPIPPQLGSLTSLTRLDLAHNILTGPIPPELGNLTNLRELDLDVTGLTGSIPPELGNLGNLRWLSLQDNGLTGPIPPQLGNLGNLAGLFIRRNDLTGPIPPEFGNLVKLRNIQLEGNDLTGPIPQSFLQLDALGLFRIGGNESLCVPGTSAFLAWLRAIERGRRDDESEILCNVIDVAALKLLYQSTDGTAWNESAGWSGDGAVEDWHGVTVDPLGRVTMLDLSHNGLAGRLPASVGNLAHLSELRIAGNTGLSGRLPLSLADLPLRALHYSATGLCAPGDRSFRDWLNAIPSHEGTGVECARLSDREILEAFYEATGGPDWTNSDNWLTDAPLGQWYGVRADRHGRVIGLSLYRNGLTGPIPSELGNLTSLTRLGLSWNSLTGLPPELGSLTSLTDLFLASNSLTGPIPPELDMNL